MSETMATCIWRATRVVGVPAQRAHFLNALGLAAVTAAAAARALSPRDGTLRPAEVNAESYFSPEEIGRVRRFTRPQRALGTAAAAVETAVLLGFVRRPPRTRSAALAAAQMSLAGTLAPLPLRAAGRARARHAGLITQDWRGWALDLAKTTALGTGAAAAIGGAAGALGRRHGARWWLPAAGGGIALSAGISVIAPVVVDPIFNRFTALPAGEAREDVLELARAAGVGVGEVFSVDASRRTTMANAYVGGLGPTKRVVLYDTLLESFTRDETRLVVAHELSHVRHRDVLRGFAFMALIAPATLRAAAAFAPGPPVAATLPALTLGLGLAGVPASLAAARMSRRLENRADTYSLRLTDSPEPFISFERKIVLQNLGDPDPPRWQRLFATHPPTVERIGVALAYAAQRGPRTSRSEAQGP
jgi:STE24 endopeptidase